MSQGARKARTRGGRRPYAVHNDIRRYRTLPGDSRRSTARGDSCSESQLATERLGAAGRRLRQGADLSFVDRRRQAGTSISMQQVFLPWPGYNDLSGEHDARARARAAAGRDEPARATYQTAWDAMRSGSPDALHAQCRTASAEPTSDSRWTRWCAGPRTRCRCAARRPASAWRRAWGSPVCQPQPDQDGTKCSRPSASSVRGLKFRMPKAG